MGSVRRLDNGGRPEPGEHIEVRQPHNAIPAYDLLHRYDHIGAALPGRLIRRSGNCLRSKNKTLPVFVAHRGMENNPIRVGRGDQVILLPVIGADHFLYLGVVFGKVGPQHLLGGEE